MPRYSVDLTTDEVEQVKAMALSEDRTMASALRCLIRRQLQVGLMLEDRVNQRQIRVDLLENSVKSASNPQSPDPGPSLAGPPDPDQDQRDQDPEGQDRKGSVRGNLDLSGVTARVIGRINELRPGRRGFAPRAYQDDIGRLVKRGHTESELLEVIEWKARECKRTRKWEWFKPGTLFRPTLFAQKLDESRAGVEHEGTPPSRRDSHEVPDATDDIWMKGVDNA